MVQQKCAFTISFDKSVYEDETVCYAGSQSNQLQLAIETYLNTKP